MKKRKFKILGLIFGILLSSIIVYESSIFSNNQNIEKTEINGIIASENQQCEMYSPFQIPVMQVSPGSESSKIKDLAAAFTSTDFIIILLKHIMDVIGTDKSGTSCY